MRGIIAGGLIALTVALSAVALVGYESSSAVYSRSKWEGSAPNCRMAYLDEVEAMLEVGLSRTKVRGILGTPDVAEFDRYEYKLTDSPFAPSKMLVILFDSADKLTEFYVKEADE